MSYPVKISVHISGTFGTCQNCSCCDICTHITKIKKFDLPKPYTIEFDCKHYKSIDD